MVIQRRTDNYTTKTSGWTDLLETSGVLSDVSGREAYILGQYQVKADHEFRCPKPKGITVTEADRLRSGAVYYKIKRIVYEKDFLRMALETGTGKNVG